MAVDIGSIDHWANNWDSYMHRASALSKVVAVGMIIAAVVVTPDFFTLLTIYLATAAAIVSTRLPALRIMAVGAYPAVFALLFAISRWDGTILTPMVIILKALAAALATLMLITTTPYPAVFAVIHGLLPRVVGDGFFLTYRSTFVLLDLAGNLRMALRLRGGLSRRDYVGNVKNISMGLGLLLIRSLALSQRVYDAMRIRGYSGRLVAPLAWRKVTAYDIMPLTMGLLLLGLVLASRFFREQVIQYNGFLLMLSIVALLGAIAYTRLAPGASLTGGRAWRR